MKYKTTTREIKDNYRNIISVPYCDAQYMLYYEQPEAYNCGIYGWNYDVYRMPAPYGDTVICTGYRTPNGNIKYDYEKLRRHETAAEKIINGDQEYKDKRGQLDNELLTFISEVTGR